MKIEKRTKEFQLGEQTKAAKKIDRIGDINAIKIEKLSSKITLISIIFPIIIGILIVFIYVKLEKSIFTGLSSGSEGMKQVAKAFKKETDYLGVMYKETKKKFEEDEKIINALKSDFKKLSNKLNNESEIVRKINSMDKNYSVIYMRVEEMEKNVQKKAEIQNLEEINLKIQNSLKLLEESIIAIKKQFENFELKTEEEREMLTFSHQKEKEKLVNLQTKIDQIKSQKEEKGNEYLDIINKQLILQKKMDSLYKMFKNLEQNKTE